eukprot:2540873-Rhodomonas_salina.1
MSISCRRLRKSLSLFPCLLMHLSATTCEVYRRLRAAAVLLVCFLCALFAVCCMARRRKPSAFALALLFASSARRQGRSSPSLVNFPEGPLPDLPTARHAPASCVTAALSGEQA